MPVVGARRSALTIPDGADWYHNTLGEASLAKAVKALKSFIHDSSEKYPASAGLGS